MKKIPLWNTDKRFATIDDSDFSRCVNFNYKWYLAPNGEAFTSVYLGGKRASPKYKMISMHRFIMGAKKGQFVDHKNGDRLDNRKNNLRFCTRTENNRNSKLRSNNTSGYKGVSKIRELLWWAYIRVDGKTLNLGRFRTRKEAAKAYNQAAIKNFGEFANLNKI